MNWGCPERPNCRLLQHHKCPYNPCPMNITRLDCHFSDYWALGGRSHRHERTSINTFRHACMHLHTLTDGDACRDIHVHVCIHTYAYIRACACICVCIYTHSQPRTTHLCTATGNTSVLCITTITAGSGVILPPPVAAPEQDGVAAATATPTEPPEKTVAGTIQGIVLYRWCKTHNVPQERRCWNFI